MMTMAVILVDMMSINDAIHVHNDDDADADADDESQASSRASVSPEASDGVPPCPKEGSQKGDLLTTPVLSTFHASLFHSYLFPTVGASFIQSRSFAFSRFVLLLLWLRTPTTATTPSPSMENRKLALPSLQPIYL